MNDKKRCYHCKRWLPKTFEYFYHSTLEKDGWNVHCKDCKKDDYRRRKERYKKQHLCACGRPAKKNSQSCIKCTQRSRRWHAANKQHRKEHSKIVQAVNKQKVMDHYGKVCACCGEWRKEFLTIDHINGGGNEHRRQLNHKGGKDFYLWLIKNNFPDGFRILCMNCNCARGWWGFCPHEQEQHSDAVSSHDSSAL